MIKSMNDLSMEVTRREGGKINLSKAQVDEVLAHVSDIHHEQMTQNGISVGTILLTNGARRSHQNGKTRK